MQFSNRRTALKGAGWFALTYLSPSLASPGSATKTIFMIDAVSELRANLGMPVDRTPTGEPTWAQFKSKPGDHWEGVGASGISRSTVSPMQSSRAEKVAGYQDYDPRLPRPDSGRLEALGGVGIPIAFADFDYWYLSGGIQWYPNPGQRLPEVDVPPGFCSDLATIPQFFWSLGLPKIGRYAYAAIIHDYLYWHQEIATREQADEILYTAMVDSGVSTITREAINFAVAKIPYFAQNAWDTNTELKKSGVKRILKVLPPRDKITSWADWSKDQSHFSDSPPTNANPVKR